ncbi:MAG TPA: hypothetical protein VGF75_01505 [Candidatus Saccharimonadales bacterium]|jgi:uncharacterized membrane-anchored protein
MRKVPEITLMFWVLKLLTTAMGEATSDFLVANISQYLAVFVGAVMLVIALIIQLKAERYKAWAYWLAVSAVAVFGTMAADGLHIQLHVPYIASTIFFALVLSVVFVAWQKSEKSLSIHSIYTTRRELFYWATVLSTFALGTAAGDLTATTVGLGYFSSGLMFIGIFLIPVVLHFVFKVNEIFTFWFAYIITRPLGASFADWLSKSKAIGGRGYGDGHVAVWFMLAIIVGVIYISITKMDVKS